VNLTVRHGVAALARRTWATAQPLSQTLFQVESKAPLKMPESPLC
jgi:hypothetical protein